MVGENATVDSVMTVPGNVDVQFSVLLECMSIVKYGLQFLGNILILNGVS